MSHKQKVHVHFLLRPKNHASNGLCVNDTKQHHLWIVNGQVAKNCDNCIKLRLRHVAIIRAVITNLYDAVGIFYPNFVKKANDQSAWRIHMLSGVVQARRWRLPQNVNPTRNKQEKLQ